MSNKPRCDVMYCGQVAAFVMEWPSEEGGTNTAYRCEDHATKAFCGVARLTPLEQQSVQP